MLKEKETKCPECVHTLFLHINFTDAPSGERVIGTPCSECGCTYMMPKDE